MKEKNEEYEALKKKALEQFKRGEPLLGKDRAFALFGVVWRALIHPFKNIKVIARNYASTPAPRCST